MKNQQILDQLPWQKDLELELKDLNKQITQLAKRQFELEDILCDLEKVDEIYEGVALMVWPVGIGPFTVCAVGEEFDDEFRTAFIYRVASERDTKKRKAYNLRLQHRTRWAGGRVSLWNVTKSEALEAAKRWVALGEETSN